MGKRQRRRDREANLRKLPNESQRRFGIRKLSLNKRGKR